MFNLQRVRRGVFITLLLAMAAARPSAAARRGDTKGCAAKSTAHDAAPRSCGRGADTQRVRQFRHSQVEMYGKGSSQSLDHWSSVFRQLIHLGYLRQDIANFSALKLTPLTKPIVRREATLALATPVARAPKQGRQSRERKAVFAGVTDEPLFQALRTVRKRLADAEEVPPFVIFSDVTLVELSKAKPTSLAQLLDITGIGKHKQEKYGRAFLEAIQNHVGPAAMA